MKECFKLDWKELFVHYPDDVNRQWGTFLGIYKEAEARHVPVRVSTTSNKCFKTPLDKKALRKTMAPLPSN